MSEKIKFPYPCDFLEAGILYFRTIWRKEGPEIYRRELMFLKPNTKNDTITVVERAWGEPKWESKINSGGHIECASSLSGYVGSGDKLTFVKPTDVDLINIFKNWDYDPELFTKHRSIQSLLDNLDRKDHGLNRGEHQRILSAHLNSTMSSTDLRMLELWD